MSGGGGGRNKCCDVNNKPFLLDEGFSSGKHGPVRVSGCIDPDA